MKYIQIHTCFHAEEEKTGITGQIKSPPGEGTATSALPPQPRRSRVKAKDLYPCVPRGVQMRGDQKPRSGAPEKGRRPV